MNFDDFLIRNSCFGTYGAELYKLAMFNTTYGCNAKTLLKDYNSNRMPYVNVKKRLMKFNFN